MHFNMIEEEIIELIRQVRIHILVSLPDNGRRQAICCPFPNHTDDTDPSFTLYPNNTYKCYGCGKQGSGAIDFCMDMGYTFIESIEELLNYVTLDKNKQID